MVVLELSDFSEDGIFAEEAFDSKFAEHDWTQYRDQAVRISGCGLTQVPGWVFLQIGIALAAQARKVLFGDRHTPKRVFSRKSIE